MKKKTIITRLTKPIALSLIFLVMVFTSCSLEEVEIVDLNKERIDFKIEGAISSFLNEESSDLVSISLNDDPILNAEEYKIVLDLGNNDALNLTIYNRDFANPLDQPFQYSAYSLDIISTRMTYVVGDYYINGERSYSTISGLVRGITQINTLRALDNTNYYLLSIQNLDMYEVSDEGIKPTKASSIKINGTFTMLK